MQAKRILGHHHGPLGASVSEALRRLAANEEMTDEERSQKETEDYHRRLRHSDEESHADESPDQPPQDQPKDKTLLNELYEEPERLTQVISSLNDEEAYKRLFDVLRMIDWSGTTIEHKKRLRDAVGAAAKSRIDPSNLDRRFVLPFRFSAPFEFLEWLKLLDLAPLTEKQLMDLAKTVLQVDPLDGHDLPYTSREQADEAVRPVYHAMLSKIFAIKPVKGRRPRVSTEAVHMIHPFPLSGRHVMFNGIETEHSKKIMRADGKLYLVNYRDIAVAVGANGNLRDAQSQAFAKHENRSIYWTANDLRRYFSNHFFEPIRPLGDLEGEELMNLLVSFPLGDITFADVLPEADTEIQAILDKAIANGELLWERNAPATTPKETPQAPLESSATQNPPPQA